MMRHSYYLFILLLGIMTACQIADSDFGKEKTFLKLYGDKNENFGIRAIPATDGGYILGGSTNESDALIYPTVTKTDQYGNTIWAVDISSSDSLNRLEDMLLAANGEIVLLSTVFKAQGNALRSDYRLVVLDADGNTLWTKDYDVDGTFSTNNVAEGVTQTADGGFAIIGTSQTATNNSDMFVVRTDASGDVVWDKVYGNTGNLNDEGKRIVELADGTFTWFGTEQVSTNRARLRLVQTNALGNILRDFNYTITDPSDGQIVSGDEAIAGDMTAILTGSNAGFYFTGSIDGVFVTVKTDLSGQLRWGVPVEIRRDANQTDLAGGIIASSEGELVLTGQSDVSVQGGDIILLRMSLTGEVIDIKEFGGAGRQFGVSIAQATSGGYIICGTADLDNTNKMQMLLKTDIFGRVSE